MGITKREIASELGVSKRTVANYIEKLGLGNHVSRNGNTDFLDDFAAAAIADALKNPGKPSRETDAPGAYGGVRLIAVFSHGIPNCVWPCKGAALDPLGRSPRDPPALLIRGVAHEVRAIGASAERRDFAPPNHPPKSRSIWVWDMGFPWARS